MSWSFSNDKPIFQQLVDIITLKIISGEYPAGSKLEAVRELAVVAGVNPNTMQRALAEIESTGLIFTKRGDGRYVTEDGEKITAAKTYYASGKVRLFIESVKALGLDDEEILNAVNNELRRQI